MTTSNVVYIPSNDKKPYFGYRAKDGNHKRSFTIMALIVSGMIQWDRKAGMVTGYTRGNTADFSSIVGTSASNHWRKTRGWVSEDGMVTTEGRAQVDASFKGEAHLRALPGIVTAYIDATVSGLLKNDAGDALETFRGSVALVGPMATTKATTATKAETATTTTATATKATTKATKATKATRSTKATKATTKKAQVLITPRAK